ncbi:MAG: transporter substrate-binding domain-containing protein [Desulfobacterales bacterium]|nr:transporter substrate-binding domain-containing protein [Desulfobacterales bacterium]
MKSPICIGNAIFYILVALTPLAPLLLAPLPVGAPFQTVASAQPDPSIAFTEEERKFIRTHPVIRVQNEDDYPPHDFSENGLPMGFSIDYLRLVAEKTGLNLEFINGYTWTRILENIKAKKLDVIHTCAENAERRRFAIFTKPYVTSNYSLIKPVRSPVESLEDLAGKKLSVLRGTIFIPDIKRQFPDVGVVEYDNTRDVLKSVLFGESAAAIETLQLAGYYMKKDSLTGLEFRRFRELGQAEPPWRIGVRKDWPALHAIIQKGMDAVTDKELDALKSRWFGLSPESGPTVSFTPEERAHLKAHPVLRVAFDVDWPPVEFVDPETGMVGIAADYLDHMSKTLGVRFEPAAPRSWKEMLASVKKGELDFFSAIAPTPQRKKWLDFTDSYLSFPIVIVTRVDVPYIGDMDDLTGRKVAIVNGYATHDLLVAHHPGLPLLPTRDVTDGLMAVIEEEAFAFVGSLATASHVIQREGLTGLKVSGKTPYRFDLSMAARKDKTVLLGLLNKALAAIPREKRNSIYNKWLSVTMERPMDYSLVWKVVAAAAVIVFLTLFWVRRLRFMTRELDIARVEAERANEAKSMFLANMSHELRTPLNAILGFSQLMAGGRNLTPDQKESLQTINHNGEHLLALINEILDMCKIEAGRIELHSEAFDLHEMLRGVEKLFQPRVDQKGLTLTFQRDPDTPRYVRVDQNKLRQVLLNILGNAVKFTERGGIWVRAGLARAPQSGAAGPTAERARLCFEIEDSGIGIAQGELDKVFDAFAQTSSGKKSRQGAGLGMPISRRFARMMGGDLLVRSEVGKGSVFTFEVRAALADAGDVPGARPTRRIVGLAPGQPVFRHLIAEDMRANRLLLLKLLEPFGFDIREATNGREAMEIWDAWRPHVIWMDMRMPEMDGYEAAGKIKMEELKRRNEGRESKTIIIAVTASSFKEERALVISAGCDDFIRKPYKATEIYEVLRKHLDARFVYEEKS